MAFIPDKILGREDYDKSFEPGPYNQVYWSEEPDPEMDLTHVRNFMVDTLCKHFEALGEHDKVLDLGCGPAIHGSLAARSHETYYADFAKPNLEALKKWFQGDESEMGVNWDHVIKLFAKKLNRDWENVKESIKMRKKPILHCDVIQPNCGLAPYETGAGLKSGGVPESFDVITTLYCFEAAAKSVKEYKEIVKRAVALLKPGGHMLYIGNMNVQDFYPVSPEKFFWVLNLSKSDILTSLEAAGMKVLDFSSVEVFPAEPGQEAEQVFGLLAKKI